MSPDKVKILGLGLLGLWVVLAAVLGYFAYDFSSLREESESELRSENEAFNGFINAPVFPSAASIESVKSNELTWGAWYDAAFALAGRGDKDIPEETPPVFKQRLQSTVRRLQSLPGEAEGKLSAPTFFFGFEKYLGEADALPRKDDIPMLAQQLDFVEYFAETLAEAGVKEVKSIVRRDPKAEDGECARHLDYAVTFATRPAALVKVINAFAASQRFVVVTDFSFRETGDTITPRLSTDKKKDAAQGRGRRGRRGAAAEEPQVDESKKANRLVTDPAVNAEFEVSMTLKVYDFRTPPEDAEPAKPKKKGAR